MAEKSSGFVSASLIILILVAAVIGAVVAIDPAKRGARLRPTALIAGFIATIVARSHATKSSF